MANRPLHVFNNTIIDAESMGASITSDSQNLDTVSGFAFHAVITGSSSPVGTLTLEGSNSDIASEYTPFKTFTVNSSSDTFLVNYDNPHFRFLRSVYTRTSGSGTLTATINGKIR
jgi:hypothetical protein